jgi:Ca2+-binding RTX toxin-like protein
MSASAQFDTGYYLTNNADVVVAISQSHFANALDHYNQFGGKELRAPNATFNPNYYAISNADVLNAVSSGVFSNVFAHFQEFGETENRAPSATFETFDAAGYLTANTDVAAAVTAGTFTSALDHFIAFGQTESRSGSGITEVVVANPGNTITLTTSVDTGSDVTGGTGDDQYIATYIADAGTGTTLNGGDNLVGRAGNDTLTLSVSGLSTAAQSITSVTLDGIETLSVSNFDSRTNDTDDTTINGITFTGVTNVNLAGSSATGDTAVTNLSGIAAAGMSNGAGDLDITYLAAAVSGSADTQALALNGTTAGAFTADNGIETLAVTSAGANAVITDLVGGTNTATMTIGATTNLTVSNELEAFTTINATGSTGNVSVVADNTTDRDLTITMGAGGDTVNMGSRLTNADTLTGGDGSDTLIVSDNSDITDLSSANNTTGFETIRLTEASTAANFDDLTGYTTIDLRNNGITTSSVAEGTAVSVSSNATGTTTHGVLSAANAGTTNAVTVTLDHGTANTDVDVTRLDMAGIETVSIVSQGVTSSTASATLFGGDQADSNSIATMNVAAATTINVSGSSDLVLVGTGGTVTANTAVNAADMTGSLVYTNRTTATAATTITGGTNDDFVTGRNGLDNITGGTGNDSLVGGGGNDIISGGDGIDTITGGAGNDVITGGGGNDIINSSTGTDNVDAGAGDDTILLATAFATDLTAADTIAGGDGADTLRVDATAAVQMVTNAGNLANVSGIETIALNAGLAQTLTINDLTLGINDGASITARAASNQAHVVNASGVLNSSAQVNLTAAAAVTGTLTYTISNAKDNLAFNASDAEILATTAAYLTANDTITGGTATGDRILFSIESATTIDTTADSHALLNATGVETIAIDTINGTAAADYVITLGDTFVANNYDNTNDLFTVTRAAADTGDTDVDGSGISGSYKLAITGGTAADTIKGGAAADTLTGGAGADTIEGGAGSDEIIGGAAADNLTGGDGSDDFHVDNSTTMDIITDFNFGAATGTTTVDQIQFNATFLGNANGAETNGDFTTAAKANNGTGSVDTISSGVTGIDAATDVAIFTGTTYANAAGLEVAIEGLNSAIVVQDLVAVYQDNFGNVRLAVAESDTVTDSGNDFVVTDFAQLTGVTISAVTSTVDIGDFIFA